MKKNLKIEYSYAITLLILAIVTLTVVTIAELVRGINISFELSFFTQFKFYSNWTLIGTILYAMMTLFKAISKTPTDSLAAAQLFTITTNTVISILYFGGLFVSYVFPETNAANPLTTWDITFKAVLGHAVIPALIMLYFFVFANKKRDLKNVLTKDSWKVMIFIGAYMLFATFRFVWLKNSGVIVGIDGIVLEGITLKRELFPYWFLSPDVLTWYGYPFVAILLLVGHSALFVFYAWAGNKVVGQWERRINYNKKI